jgi:hypothetical protein
VTQPLDSNQPLDSKERERLRAVLIEMRDETAREINGLDEARPTSEEEYLAEKTRLMSRWRDLGIMAIQMQDTIDLN